ncbi:MAG: TetR/AcrR family transcriptional regulator [Anaerolineae bacterium]|nr:TetR/AcrR family transcriptional regulator [Anaerolineae bacterium]
MSLKDNIIRESMKQFSSKGYLNTSITDIINAADTSKGGFYNHFQSKEELFHDVLAEAQSIWREKTLFGLREIDGPVEKIKKLLENYRDRYLIDDINFPGGCIFVTFSIELDDQRPHLMKDVNSGFAGLKGMLKRFLEEGKAQGDLRNDVNTNRATELIFSGMIGTSVLYGVDKSATSLARSINALIEYLDNLAA